MINCLTLDRSPLLVQIWEALVYHFCSFNKMFIMIQTTQTVYYSFLSISPIFEYLFTALCNKDIVIRLSRSKELIRAYNGVWSDQQKTRGKFLVYATSRRKIPFLSDPLIDDVLNDGETRKEKKESFFIVLIDWRFRIFSTWCIPNFLDETG